MLGILERSSAANLSISAPRNLPYSSDIVDPLYFPVCCQQGIIAEETAKPAPEKKEAIDYEKYGLLFVKLGFFQVPVDNANDSG